MSDPEMTCEVVEAAFAAALDVPALSHTEGFFDLGADSMVIVKAMSTLARRWPFLRPVDVFVHPTIESLAAFISTRSTGRTENLVVCQRELPFHE